MRTAVYILALLGTAAGCLAGSRVAAGEEGVDSEGSRQEGYERWVPSVSLVSGVTIQGWRGAVESDFCQGCSIPDPLMREVPLRASDKGGDTDVAPFVGARFELMTPELPIRTSPRLFIGASIVAAFGLERTVANEGDPGTLASPLPEGAVNAPFGEGVVLGQGSKTVATLDNLIYGAHAGVAFPFEFSGRRLWFKPAVGWARYEVAVAGLIVNADCAAVPGGTQCNTNLPTGFLRETRLEGSASRTFDGIGPAIDIEMDTGRFGPIGSSIFLGIAAYYVLGDRQIIFGASQSFNDQLGTDSASGQFHFEMDRWMLRAGLGMRFHWLGFDD